MPTNPTPVPVPEKLTVKQALKDVTVFLGGVVTVGEGILAALPSGPVRTAIQIGLPIVSALVAALVKVGG